VRAARRFSCFGELQILWHDAEAAASPSTLLDDAAHEAR